MRDKFLTTTKTGMVLKTILLAGLALSLLASVSCAGATKISEIKSDSAKWEGKTVTVKGTVAESIWLELAGKGTYQIGDGSDTIWIISTQPPPANGLSVTTEGTVQSAFTILGTVYGTVIQETKRH
jgi:hypothetical protein